MTSSINSNQIFTRSNHLLHQLSEEQKRPILSELKDLNQAHQLAARELDPSNRNFHLISEHRKNQLLQKMQGIIQKIDTKLTTAGESASQTALRRAYAVVELQQRLPSFTPKSLHKTLKELDPAVTNKIYFYVWLASSCPHKPEFGRDLLRADFSILQQTFPGLLNTNGTLLEQIAEDFLQECAIQKEMEAIHDLEGAGQDPTQHRLRLDQLTQERDRQKEALFHEREGDIYFSRTQLKKLFETMPASVQAKLPQPPYYGRGFNAELYKTLGAHFDSSTGMTTFRLYAPKAREIVLHLTAWGNVEHQFPLVKGEDGVWTAQTQHAGPGRTYHYMITGINNSQPVKKIDPFAFGNHIHCSVPGKDDHESVVRDTQTPFAWTDGAWMAKRPDVNPAKQPTTIYEVHAPSWKKKSNGDTYNWRELATDLGQYCREMGYTHVELMAVFEHTQPISMGYQITNYFCINSRMGSLDDFKTFVNEMHRQGIGVFVDWVPAHFAIDKFALGNFEGSALFEDDDTRFATHPYWGTYEFDVKKQHTKDFLASNARWVLDECHVDGLRYDAVEAMIYLHHDNRKNRKGHDINLDAKAFLRDLNTYLHRQLPGVLLMAEEAAGYPSLIRPTSEKGISGIRGFDFDLAWHMGFMNEIFKYVKKFPHERSAHHSSLTKTIKDIDYNGDTRPRGKVVIAISHDECATGKMTIQSKMPGLDYERFANGRLFLAYQLLRGGGPILDFMGSEILQSTEWHGRLQQALDRPNDLWEQTKSSVQWEELDPTINPRTHHFHRGAQQSRKALNHLYLTTAGLWDQTDQGFAWIDASDSHNSVVSFHRRNQDEQLACIFNFSNRDLTEYLIRLPTPDYAPELTRLTGVREVFNTDDRAFAGDGRVNSTVEILRNAAGQPTHFKLRLAPFSAIVLKEAFS